MIEINVKTLFNYTATDEELRPQIELLLQHEHPGKALLHLLLNYAPKRGIAKHSERILMLMKDHDLRKE